MNEPVTSADLMAILRKKYPAKPDLAMNAYVVLEEVPNAVGYATDRHIDAVVFSLWPSKGLTRTAFEIKVSRQDFLRELNNPVKHRWCHECFHQFWFLAPLEVIKEEELPEGAGWMYPRGGKLVIKRHAAHNPKPRLDDHLLAAFMRAAWKSINSQNAAALVELNSNNPLYKNACMCKEAMESFLSTRLNYSYYGLAQDKEGIISQLDQTTTTNAIKKEREQLLRVSGEFQRRMVDLFELFAVIAHRSILERNELGKYFVEVYGAVDPHLLETIRRDKRNDSHYAKIVERLLSWNSAGVPVREIAPPAELEVTCA